MTPGREGYLEPAACALEKHEGWQATPRGTFPSGRHLFLFFFPLFHLCHDPLVPC